MPRAKIQPAAQPNGVGDRPLRMRNEVTGGFAEFYLATWHRLLRTVVLVTADRGDAEDVLQEAYAKAARDWSTVSAMADPAAWVRRVAVNASLDEHRRRRRRKAAYARLRPEPVHHDDLSLEVMDALRALPVAERQVVVLHHLLQLTVTAISEELSRPAGTVKAQLVRGRRQLATLLELDVKESS